MLQRVINKNLYNKKANIPIMEEDEESLINDVVKKLKVKLKELLIVDLV